MLQMLIFLSPAPAETAAKAAEFSVIFKTDFHFVSTWNENNDWDFECYDRIFPGELKVLRKLMFIDDIAHSR